jgi:hypothetical protein
MTHREKVRHLIADLGERDINPSTVAPPLYRLFWLLGSKVPPPHFQRSSSLAILSGITFAVLYGIGMYIFMNVLTEMPFWLVGVAALLAGVIMGGITATAYRRQSATLRLPPWEEYPQR